MHQIITNLKDEIEKILSFFQEEMSGIRSNRPHSGLLENIKIDYMGSLIPLKQMATISVSQPNSLLVQPWDKSSLPACEKAIISANLGVSTANEGSHIRVILPTLSAERRQELVKLAHKKSEESKVHSRRLRDDARKEVQKIFDSKEIGEDDKFKIQDDIQKEIDNFSKKIDELVKIKEGELSQ